MTTAPDALLQVQDLSVSYGGTEVVHDVGFSVRPGSSLALIGESGSGKSTIARAVLRLLPAEARASGDVRFAGSGGGGCREDGRAAGRQGECAHG